MKRSGSGEKGKVPPGLGGRNGLWTWILFGVAVIMLFSVWWRPEFAFKEVPYSEFKTLIKTGEIKRVLMSPGILKGFPHETALDTKAKGGLRPPTTYYVTNGVMNDASLIPLMEEAKVVYEIENDEMRNLFIHWLLPIIAVVLVWRMLFSRAFRMGPGAGLMSFGKNRARLVQDDSKRMTFEDVAGVDEAKEELSEIIEFLKTPQKFRAVGGKIPKGILLVGPPGTGKTLLARAVAGEAGVPFFSLSGSEFVEMFVGVGAARVRDLFAQAVEKSPCIIFIDELDAIGKVRSAVSPMGGHDEREQTLNQLLVEMDGFDTRTGVIMMAATNRPETLDPALLRAGRFDRQVLVDRPDIKGREAILKIHSKTVKLTENIDLHVVAARTPGFVGADLANVVNEAALLAVRKGKNTVDIGDFDDAIDRVIAGLQKKTRLMNQMEKRIVAIHEMGHALVTCFSDGADPVHKVSVIPRGFGALGFTMALPKEDRYLMTRKELIQRTDILLGGRVAEEVCLGEISTGAQDDLHKATDIVKAMVMDYGMSAECGQRTFQPERSSFINSPGGPMTFQKEYSEASAERIDREIEKLLADSYLRVRALLQNKNALLMHIASILSEKEVLEGKELLELIKDFENPQSTAPAPLEGGESATPEVSAAVANPLTGGSDAPLIT
ncbi:MAG: ATP-dependent metallopeptidase FtsH/Yme1/Tma family protein [Deltaproteobacteria bacterium]|nr:ATP-dependent metallopeptidase FtsH/Yme1/Tma family protein [Deltaproteobacteria bacterium]